MSPVTLEYYQEVTYDLVNSDVANDLKRSFCQLEACWANILKIQHIFIYSNISKFTKAQFELLNRCSRSRKL